MSMTDAPTLPDLSQVQHHKAIEDLTTILCNRVQNDDRPFFRTLVAYHLMMISSTMRGKLNTLDRGEVPINGYAVCLATSGAGKGHSMGILENEIFADFRRTFTDHTLPHLAEASMWKLAIKRAARNGTEEQFEYDKLSGEYDKAGEYVFVFDDAHSSAVKQLRSKLLISGAGSINFVVDEIGSNLEKISQALPLFLELYDKGYAKEKLYMNTNDRKRVAQVEGTTPANILLFGTPAKLFDGGKTETSFYEQLETGYARRCLFSMGTPTPAHDGSDNAELFDKLCDPNQGHNIQLWADHFATLADPSKFNWTIDVPRDVGIAILDYKTVCENAAKELPEHNEVRKAELSHRYFKAMKLAGALAFVEESLVLTKDHLYAAIKLVEESGQSFASLLKREKPYMKLARFIATCENEVTHSDLVEELPFYSSGQAARNELLTMATAWGYKQHIIIKRRYVDDVEFISGEALRETDLDQMMLSHSDDWAFNYEAEEAPFEDLDKLLTLPDYNWSTHAYKDGHRHGENVLPEFNMAVFDIDGTASLDTVHDLLEGYAFITQTTKRHTPDNHRFRLILPLSYHLKLDKEDYQQFKQNLLDWLPFESDADAAKDIVRKWATNEHAQVHKCLDGKLLDVLPFIPRTKRDEQRRKELKELGSLDALERWFAHRFMNGDRNNQMLKFAMALADSGMDYSEVETKVTAFNAKLANSLSIDELRKTVFVSVAKKLQASHP